MLLTTAQRDARVASPDRKIKVRRFDLQATLGGAAHSSRRRQQHGPRSKAGQQALRVQPCSLSTPAPVALAEPRAPRQSGAQPSTAGAACSPVSLAWVGARIPFRTGRASDTLASDSGANDRARVHAREIDPVFSRVEVIALLADVLVLAGGRQRTITTATLAIGFSLVAASFAAFAAAELVPDWLTPAELVFARTLTASSSFTGAAFVLLSLSPAAAYRARLQLVAISFGAILGSAWVLIGDVTILRTLVAPGYVSEWAVIDPSNTRFFVAYRIAQALLYLATWCIASFALVALALASICIRRVSTRFLLSALWAHLGGASLSFAIHRAVSSPLNAFSGVWVHADAETGRLFLVISVVASVSLLAQAIATQFVGIRHRLVRLIARVCCSASGAEASLAPLLGFGSRYGERAPDDVCAEAEHAFRPRTLAPVLLAHIETSGLGAHLNNEHQPRAPSGRSRRPLRASHLAASASRASGANACGLPALTPQECRVEGPTWLPLAPALLAERKSASSAREPEARMPLACADAYVVHCAKDDAHLRAAALCRWARAFAEAHGRPPTVWLDMLCADISFSPVEALAHVPVHMAKCKQLVLLVGPALLEHLEPVVQCYAWEAIGKRLLDAHVELVAANARTRNDIVAGIDTFHVMNTRAAAGEVHERLVAVVEIASASHVNVTLRELLEPARRALDAAETRNASPARAALCQSSER